MKTVLIGLGIALLLCSTTPQTCYAVTALNTQYSCAPPFVANVAKPNIHFVLDITGSMKYFPYIIYDSTYYPTTSYYGYFKEDKYYKYDFTANNYWQENASCTNTDLIGTTNRTTGTCVSGRLLNYMTSNKYDIMRKILTGGRPWTDPSTLAVIDSTVLEHELGQSNNLSNEATTNCSVDNGTASKVIISSPNPSTGTVVSTISSSSTSKFIAVSSVGSKTTFTITGGVYTTTGVVPGVTEIKTAGFTDAANNGSWVVASISSTVITVTNNSGVAAAAKKSVTITTAPLTVGPVCKVLTSTVNIPMTVTATNKITRADVGGSFIADGWVAGMAFDADGFASSSNNSKWTIASGGVTDSVITITTTGLATTAIPVNARLTQNLTAYVRVKYAAAETPFTGVIQSMYNGPGDAKTKADIELSFFNNDGAKSVDYTGGDTTNITVKNKPLANYINAVNLTSGTGSTNTGPAMAEAEKFFKQVAINTAITKVPAAGVTQLIAAANGASDPFYEPPLDGTAATTANSTPAPCRKAFVVLVSDGEWNVGTDPAGPAYHMHRTDEILPSTTPKTYYDLRPDSTEPSMKDKQSVTTYAVYAFGESASGRNALITTAIFGGFKDVETDNNNLPFPFTNSPPAFPYTATSVNLKTISVTGGFDSIMASAVAVEVANAGMSSPNPAHVGSKAVSGASRFLGDNLPTYPLAECRPDSWDTRCAEWDKSPGPTAALPTQKHTGLPYNYFEPTDGSGAALAKTINDAITSIFAKVSSGTAASILSNSEGTGANLLQAVYYPSKVFADGAEVNWIGEMQNLWYYVDPFISNSSIREDTDGDRVLNLKNDNATRFFFDVKENETKVETKKDTNGDGVGDTLVNASISPDDVKSIWRAGRQLQTRSADSRTIHTSIDGLSLVTYPDTEGGFSAKTTRAGALQSYLQAVSLADSQNIIKYIRGDDLEGVVVSPAYRKRKGALVATDTPTVWKLGDIISSTPRLQSSNRISLFDSPRPSGYNDASYAKFVTSANYKKRGMVYVGTNDGMLHAFKLGTLTVSGPSISGSVKATLTGEGTAAGTKLGDEQWAYIPRNALPYLKYLTDSTTFKHLYYVDGSTQLADVSTGMSTGCTASDYSQCTKDTTAGSNWRTILIGSMGLGGASNKMGTTACKDLVDDATLATATCVKTPILDPLDATKGLGYSSYFAMDITNQYFDSAGVLVNQPSLKWEFADPRLGYSTSGSTVVRISAKKTVGTLSVSDTTKNGKSFAVFASGPTGPIGYGDFKGKSDQNLKLFVVDLGSTGALVENTNYWVLDTDIKRAFGGSVVNASIDTDRWSATADGNYQDDAIYVGYSKANIADAASITAATEWTDGGVIRLITKESANPADWKTSVVISGIGPVTAGISRLQDRKNHKLWLFFGSGRFYYGGDDKSSTRYIMGVADPCYQSNDTINKACADAPPAALTKSDLKDQATIAACDLGDKKGWYITLDGASTTMDAERSITDPVALTNGMVQFTTFKPAADVCKFGGDSYIWAVKYNDGCNLPAAALGSKVLLQVSTGAFEEVDLKNALTDKDGRKMGASLTGRPSTPQIVSNASNKPPKKILHLQEK